MTLSSAGPQNDVACTPSSCCVSAEIKVDNLQDDVQVKLLAMWPCRVDTRTQQSGC